MVGENTRDPDNKSQGDGLDQLAKLHLAKTSGSVLSVPTSSPSSEVVESQKEEDVSEKSVKDKFPKNKGFKDILYGNGESKTSTIRKYTFTIPSELIEELEEMLDTLPSGVRSSKSQIVTSLLKDFIEKNKESVMSYGNDVARFQKETGVSVKKK